ncbi:hypothetical protein RJZ57_005091 [Blastomyces gilchristii]
MHVTASICSTLSSDFRSSALCAIEAQVECVKGMDDARHVDLDEVALEQYGLATDVSQSRGKADALQQILYSNEQIISLQLGRRTQRNLSGIITAGSLPFAVMDALSGTRISTMTALAPSHQLRHKSQLQHSSGPA